jgi:hypothetical protein
MMSRDRRRSMLVGRDMNVGHEKQQNAVFGLFWKSFGEYKYGTNKDYIGYRANLIQWSSNA